MDVYEPKNIKIDGFEYLKGIDFKVPEAGRKNDTAKPWVIADFKMKLRNAMTKGYFRRNDGRIMMYDGMRYLEMSTADSVTLIMDVMEYHGYANVYITKYVEETHKFIHSSKHIPEFSPKRNYICFTNGIYDIETGNKIKPDQSIEAYIYIPHAYIENPHGVEFKKFINHVLPCKEDQMVLQEALGCMFIDRSSMKLENCFYLYGTGANGKSVISDLLMYMLGSEFMSGYSMEELLIDNDKLKNRAEIAGKLINFCSDMGTKDYRGGDYKKIVSGESMNCRRMYGLPFSTNLIPLFFASVNEFPQQTDFTHGNFRRDIIIPFSVTIADKDQDKSLGTKLRGEISYFIKWILEGYERIKRQKLIFTYSEHVVEVTNQIKQESHSVLMYLALKEYYPKAIDNDKEYIYDWYLVGNVHHGYVDWYEGEYGIPKGGNAKYVKKPTFRKMLSSEGFELRRDTTTKQYDVMIFTPTGNEKEEAPKTELELIFDEQKAIDNLPF